ncbi:hypothetical protein VIMS_04275 [Mycobacterium marinum]|nr:hypothetical protein VIMS_04275 [Mycobacterium marinum]
MALVMIVFWALVITAIVLRAGAPHMAGPVARRHRPYTQLDVVGNR